jgi:zinc transport system ATP-binding protein
MMAQLTIEHLTVAYQQRVAVRDVTLEARGGEIVVLIGPNGAGKSTLLKAVAGTLEPNAGRIALDGVDMARLRPVERARLVAVVPQAARLPEAFTAGEVVLMGRNPHLPRFGGERPSDYQAAQQAMLRTDTWQLAERRVGELSGGEQQRVLIARALVSKPELLILDEPTGGVDPEAQTSFYALLHHLNRERDVTLILVSHDIGVVAKEVTKLACLNRRLIFHGRPGDFLGDAALAALYGPAVRVVSHDH